MALFRHCLLHFSSCTHRHIVVYVIQPIPHRTGKRFGLCTLASRVLDHLYSVDCNILQVRKMCLGELLLRDIQKTVE